MLLCNIRPGKHLQSFIRFYRIIDFDFSQQHKNHTNVKAYRPRIEHCLQFTPFDSEIVDYSTKKNITHKAALFGQQTELSYRKVGKRFLNFQIIFQPGVLHSLLGVPMDEIVNEYLECDLFFGNRIQEVNERLAECPNYESMLMEVETFLSELIRKKHPEVHPVNRIANLLSSSDSFQDISWFANQANLSFRQFDRTFKANTGILPKDFRNLVKLDRAYLLKNRNPQMDWLSIALQSGFYDYQHLSKKYLRFFGHTPTSFYQLEQQAPERHFGDFEQ